MCGRKAHASFIGGLEIALQRLLHDDADQPLGDLDAQPIELADRGEPRSSPLFRALAAAKTRDSSHRKRRPLPAMIPGNAPLQPRAVSPGTKSRHCALERPQDLRPGKKKMWKQSALA
jgi:hypothetical protein